MLAEAFYFVERTIETREKLSMVEYEPPAHGYWLRTLPAIQAGFCYCFVCWPWYLLLPFGLIATFTQCYLWQRSEEQRLLAQDRKDDQRPNNPFRYKQKSQ